MKGYTEAEYEAMTASAQKTQSKRSKKSRQSDNSQSNKKTLPMTLKNLQKWRKNPGDYDLEGIDTIKRLARKFHRARAEEKKKDVPDLPEYDKKDLEAARRYLKDHDFLYEDGPHYIELQAEIAKAINQGIDPAMIDYASHLSEDKSLKESLESERDFELLEMRGSHGQEE